jgi:hypothetical protein
MPSRPGPATATGCTARRWRPACAWRPTSPPGSAGWTPGTWAHPQPDLPGRAAGRSAAGSERGSVPGADGGRQKGPGRAGAPGAAAVDRRVPGNRPVRSHPAARHPGRCNLIAGRGPTALHAPFWCAVHPNGLPLSQSHPSPLPASRPFGRSPMAWAMLARYDWRLPRAWTAMRTPSASSQACAESITSLQDGGVAGHVRVCP